MNASTLFYFSVFIDAMKKNWRLVGLVWISIFWNCCLLIGQTDTLVLPEIEVAVATGFSGEQKDLIDSSGIDLQLHQHLGQLLGNQSGVYIKNYGAGSSATTSIRGGSAEHTRVLWNGLPIENPMLGQFDFSLVPNIFVDEVRIHNGSNTAAWGNGAIGGTVALNNQMDWKKSDLDLTYGMTLGAFGLASQGVKTSFGGKKLKFTNRLFYTKSDNDFEFLIREDLPKRKQTNAYFEQYGLLQGAHWRPSLRHHFNVYFWWQDTERQLPPTTTQRRSVAYQLDDTYRLTADWTYFGNQLQIKAQTAWYDEAIHYVDAINNYDDESSFNTLITQIHAKKILGQHHQLTAGIRNNFQTAFADFYDEKATQNRLAFWSRWKTTLSFLNLDLAIRQEWQDEERLPIVPSLGLEIPMTSFIWLHGKISRNYRSPNLNALYYRPSGNSDLLPESGWSQEAGLRFLIKNKKQHSLRFSATAYHRVIDNWIRWIVSSVDFSVSPINIASVRSRGMEYRLDWKRKTKNRDLSIGLGYNFTQSQHQNDIPELLIKKGDQLVYTPKHLVFSTVHFQYKNSFLNYHHRFSGKVNTLNLTTLDDYQIGNLQLGHQFKTTKFINTISLTINNLFDVNYRILERRGMPGRHLEVKLLVKSK